MTVIAIIYDTSKTWRIYTYYAIGSPFIVILEEKLVVLVIVKCIPISQKVTGRKKYDKDVVTAGVLHMELILPQPP